MVNYYYLNLNVHEDSMNIWTFYFMKLVYEIKSFVHRNEGKFHCAKAIVRSIENTEHTNIQTDFLQIVYVNIFINVSDIWYIVTVVSLQDFILKFDSSVVLNTWQHTMQWILFQMFFIHFYNVYTQNVVTKLRLFFI